MAQREKDAISGTETTGHEWDGIKELNTPLPRWWILTFYATIVFAIGYTIAYPAWPLPGGATPGLLGFSSRANLEKSVSEAAAAQADMVNKIAAANLGDIMKDDAMRAFAKAAGAAAFKVNCVQCHGSGAAGAVGYPNLNDNDWIWGGTIEQIHQTITDGVNYTADANTRVSQMPVFGPDPANGGSAILTSAQILDVANYVVTLSGGKPDDAQAADRGKQLFADNCASCHGDKGQGNRDVGAPNLSDAIWLFSKDGGVAAVAAQVTRPRQGVMPAWTGKLDPVRIKELAVYVHTLGGGEQATQ
jgi:cytochrome c oxidase cbb3-type subunit 3